MRRKLALLAALSFAAYAGPKEEPAKVREPLDCVEDTLSTGWKDNLPYEPYDSGPNLDYFSTEEILGWGRREIVTGDYLSSCLSLTIAQGRFLEGEPENKEISLAYVYALKAYSLTQMGKLAYENASEGLNDYRMAVNCVDTASRYLDADTTLAYGMRFDIADCLLETRTSLVTQQSDSALSTLDTALDYLANARSENFCMTQ